MKSEDIKKRLITEASIASGVIVVLGAISYFLTMLEEDYEKEKNELQTQVASVSNERQSLENKYQKINNSLDLYRIVAEKAANNQLEISREPLRQKVEEFKTRYFLNDMSLTMGPVQELKGSQYRYKTAGMTMSELTVNFDALADEHIYSLIRDMQEGLPGSLKVTKLTLARTNKITDEGLRTIAKSGQYSLIKGDVKFNWYGIQPIESDKPPENK